MDGNTGIYLQPHPKSVPFNVGTQFIASTNLLKEFGGVWIPLNKLVDAINWVPTLVIKVQIKNTLVIKVQIKNTLVIKGAN
jgi:hypothetical protein